MKGFILFVILAVFLSRVCPLPPPTASYKILLTFPFASKSHRNVFMPLVEALLQRGHKVWLLSPFGPTMNHPNFTEVNHGLPGMSGNTLRVFDIRTNLSGWRTVFSSNMVGLARDMYKKENVKELLKMKDEFDAVIFSELFGESAFAFLEGKTTISMATAGVTPMYSAMMGNVFPSSYTAPLGFGFTRPYSLMTRFLNFILHTSSPYFWTFFLDLNSVERELKDQFPSFSSLKTLYKNVSLVLTNSYFSADFASPLLPNQVEVGGMYCRPSNPLPKELNKWINESNDTGVVYFSLGSITQGSHLTPEFRGAFVKAFARIKQKVLWKHEEDIPELSSNVLLQKWLPQQDVLAHPNIKVFITHSGLLSTHEAIYHATPMIAIPLFADQFRNSKMVSYKKYGLDLDWESFTADKLVEAIEEVVGNPIYTEEVRKASEALRDRQISASDTAVWWTEYVIRNHGAPLLKNNPAKDLSIIEFYNLDIILILHIIFIVIFKIFKIAFRKLFCQTSKTNVTHKKIKIS